MKKSLCVVILLILVNSTVGSTDECSFQCPYGRVPASVTTTTSTTTTTITTTSTTTTIAQPGPTEVSGIISENTTWTVTGSPYIVTGNLLVEEGVILTIEPGVEVKFDGDYYLKVDGALLANGTVDNRIIFTSNKENPVPGDWMYLYFSEKASNSIISYSKVLYGGGTANFPGAIRVDSSSLTLDNNLILKNARYGVYVVGSSSIPVVIRDNTFYENDNGIGLSGAYATILQNTIYSNSEAGIWIRSGNLNISYNTITDNGNGFLFDNSAISSLIAYNNIYSNEIFDMDTSRMVNYQNINDVNAPNNWWGTTSTSEIDQSIYDFYDDFDLGKVLYKPILTTPNTNAPIPPVTGLTIASTDNAINLSWDVNPATDVLGYRIYYDTDSGMPYNFTVDVGNITNYSLTGINAYTNYYISVTAYDDSGDESWYSDEVNATMRITCNSCSDCSAKLNGAYERVMLTADIYNHSGNCITFGTSNVEFDCQGHGIDGKVWVTEYDSGVYMHEKSNNTVKNCVISDYWSGIFLSRSSNNTLINNTASSNSEHGIYLWYSSGNILAGNTASNNGYGIHNGYGISLLDYSDSNTLTNNTASSNKNWGFYLYYCSNNILAGNTASNNVDGFYIRYSDNNTFTNNTASSNNYRGVFLTDSRYNIVNSNKVCFNTQSDFYLLGSLLGNFGDENTCDVPNGWNDTGTIGCTYSCSGATTTTTSTTTTTTTSPTSTSTTSTSTTITTTTTEPTTTTTTSTSTTTTTTILPSEPVDVTFSTDQGIVSPGDTVNLNININSQVEISSAQLELEIPSDLGVGSATTNGFMSGATHLPSGNEHRWFNLDTSGFAGTLGVPLTIPWDAEYGTTYTINLTGVDLKDTNDDVVAINQELPLSITLQVKVTVQDIFDALDSYFDNQPSSVCSGNICTVEDIFDLLDEYFA